MRKTNTLICVICLLFSVQFTTEAALKVMPVSGKGKYSWLLEQAINCIAQDNEGFIWISTYGGVLRYDGTEFYLFTHNPDDSQSLSDNNAREIVPDRFRGGMWICTENGLNHFNPKTGKFNHAYYINKNNDISQIRGRINDVIVFKDKIICSGNSKIYICDATDGNSLFKVVDIGIRPISLSEFKDGLFIAGNHDGAYVISIDDMKVVSSAPFSSSEYSYSTIYYSTLTDRIYLGNGIGTGSAVFTYDDGGLKRNDSFVPDNLQRVCDSNGKTLFGTNGNGLYILEEGKLSHMTVDEGLTSNVVTAFCHDMQENLWLGLYRGGIMMNQRNMETISVITQFKMVSSVIPERNRIYVGTDGYGLGIYDRRNGSVRMLDTSNSTLPGNNIVSMCRTGDVIWLGVYTKGLCSFNTRTEEFRTYSLEDHDELYVDNNKVWIVVHDDRGRIWVGGPSLFMFSPESRKFTKVNGLGGKFISSVAFGKEITYVATRHSGIFKLDMNSLDIIDTYDCSTVPGFPEDDVKYVYLDNSGKLWFSTQAFGFYSIDAETRSIKKYDENDGLFNGNVTVINEDEHGNLWIGTMNGLYYYSSGKFIHLSDAGYIPAQYLYSAGHYDNEYMYLGSTEGLVIFENDRMVIQGSHSKICFTELTTLSEEPQRFPFFSSNPPPVRLGHEDNFFSVSISVPEYISPESVQISCRLTGMEKEWRNIGSPRTLTFTGLKPGDYVLEVRYSHLDGNWSEPSVLEIRILPEWYATWWARTLWLCIFIALLILLMGLYLRQQKIKEKIRINEIEKKSIKELNDAKLDFFTRIIHELRTPIFLITTQLEVFDEQDGNKISISKKYFDSLLRNSRKLTRLVNKMIDFRKLDSDMLGLKLRELDVVSFCEYLVPDYAELCSKKEMSFTVNLPDHPVLLSFDSDKLESVLSNLVSNAFKYTKEGGEVEMVVREVENGVEFNIKDNGIGILPENLDTIFDYFSRTERGTKYSSGDGIGLAVVKSFVELHGGHVIVASKPEVGSIFSFVIPFGLSSITSSPAVISDALDEYDNICQPQISVSNPTAAHSILIIDDDQETADLIERCLEASYRIYKADNGEDGYKIATKMLPNLVICDLDMPHMNGHEFLVKLRKDHKMDGVKILILTGNNSEEEMMRTLNEGADAHLMKPISIRLLKININKLIQQHEDSMLVNDTMEHGKNYTPEEQMLLLKCKEIIDEHLSDEDFSMEFMAEKLAMSHSLLYKKIRTITGMSLIGFVNDYKITKAVLLFRQGEINVTSVCERCGFKDEKNFRDMFKRKIGMTPKQYVLSVNTKSTR